MYNGMAPYKSPKTASFHILPAHYHYLLTTEDYKIHKLMLHELRLKKQIFSYSCTILLEMPPTSSKYFNSKFTLITYIMQNIKMFQNMHC